jgi:1-phosphofructokinase
MIYTVTLNPSIDYVMQVNDITVGETNRAKSEQMYPGGKGINVSRLLAHIDVDTTALGFVGGFTGEHIRQALTAEGFTTAFTQVSGNSRINVKLKGSQETEINGAGPEITDLEIATFMSQFDNLTAEDVVVLSGSIPSQIDKGIYDQLIAKVQVHNATFVLDTTGAELKKGLAKKPLLVKPNKAEVAELYQTDVTDNAVLKELGFRLLADGAQYAMISLAGDGAALFTPDGAWFAPAVKGTVKNSVGAGDSMIAGFVGTWRVTNDPLESFKQAVASGTATAFSDDIASAEMIQTIYEQVQIESFD